MNWTALLSNQQLVEIITISHQRPQVIFKHSTRCSISRIALTRLEKAGSLEGADFYFLDLLAYRKLSGQVAETFRVVHESPQLLLIKNGECIYDESHLGISPDELQEQISLAVAE
ncbi:MAG: bacillithiol system redox-active protein YtxJ [Sphingobacteriales bacterium]|nr:bacillithiol system redox-active protein YtxJ [Sphingobacteriales bacterium]